MELKQSRLVRHRHKPKPRKKRNRAQGAILKLPSAMNVELVLPVAFPLSALIPEDAARKFAANEPFSVYANDGVNKSLILYLGHEITF